MTDRIKGAGSADAADSASPSSKSSKSSIIKCLASPRRLLSRNNNKKSPRTSTTNKQHPSLTTTNNNDDASVHAPLLLPPSSPKATSCEVPPIQTSFLPTTKRVGDNNNNNNARALETAAASPDPQTSSSPQEEEKQTKRLPSRDSSPLDAAADPQHSSIVMIGSTPPAVEVVAATDPAQEETERGHEGSTAAAAAAAAPSESSKKEPPAAAAAPDTDTSADHHHQLAAASSQNSVGSSSSNTLDSSSTVHASPPSSGATPPPALDHHHHHGSTSSGNSSNKVHLATSLRKAVQESWTLVESHLDELGMDFFLALFRKHPQLKELFHFGGADLQDLPQSKLLQAHASGVMKTVGVALQGLDDMEALVPVLRNLGRTHTLVGVQPADYDLIYAVLIETIKKHVGPEKWNPHTQEAWELCYMSIASVMKDPSRHLQVEPAEGWGLWVALVSAYLAVVTPLQLADFQHGGSCSYWFGVLQWWWQSALALCNGLAVVTCLFDWSSEYLHRAVQLKSTTTGPPAASRQHGSSTADNVVTGRIQAWIRQNRRAWFPILFRVNRLIRRLGLSRWAPWPASDTAVVVSFGLQWLLFSNNQGIASSSLSLYYVLGLVRLVAVARVVHFVRCLELVSLKRSGASGVVEYFHYGRLVQLFLVMVYMIHLFGCLHRVVSGLDELDNTEPQPDAPPPHALNAYLREAYWAFVNVAGIGADDSVPETCIEIVFSMMVHLLGASFYAIAAGNVFAILEARAAAFHKVGDGVAALKQFMQDCDIPDTSQDAFLSTFLMQNLVLSQERGTAEEAAAAESSSLAVPSSAETSLPRHLVVELELFSRSKAIRNRAIPTASIDFSFCLAERLTEKLTLLSGDYLFRAGDQVRRRVWMVDKGVLEVFVNGVSERRLYQGDIIGVGWLATLAAAGGKSDERRRRRQSTQGNVRHKAYLDWMSPSLVEDEDCDGVAFANVRAMEACRLVMGLSDARQVHELQALFPHDIQQIRTACEAHPKDLEWEEKKTTTMDHHHHPYHA